MFYGTLKIHHCLFTVIKHITAVRSVQFYLTWLATLGRLGPICDGFTTLVTRRQSHGFYYSIPRTGTSRQPLQRDGPKRFPDRGTSGFFQEPFSLSRKTRKTNVYKVREKPTHIVTKKRKWFTQLCSTRCTRAFFFFQVRTLMEENV